MPLSPSETRALLLRLGHRPNKRLGQNFLVDGNIVHKSLELAGVVPGDRVVEIGPGLGTLSAALLEAGCEVWAIEFDPRLHAHLAATLAPAWPERFHLAHGDAVDAPRANFAPQSDYKIVANLPYAISTPWMEKVLAGPLPAGMVLMLQKEAADRFTASAGQKNYGAISIFLESCFQRRPGHRVARGCFYPTPEVDSTLLCLERLPEPCPFSAAQREFIRGIFTQRRKQIGSLVNKHPRAAELRPWLDELAVMGVPETTRPEAIPLAGWRALPECADSGLPHAHRPSGITQPIPVMSLNLDRFQNPPVTLRGAPFWSLNTDLTNHQRLRDQIDAFAEMGMGGYHLHVRVGLKTPYLNQDFLDAIHAARDHGASKGLLSYLYDEDTWPSGFAGGAVTRELTHRVNHMTLRKGRSGEAPSAFSQPQFAYRVKLDNTGRLLSAERIAFEDGADDDWFLYHEIAPDNDRFNGAAYVDAMSPAAIRAFIDSTHEVYLKSFGGEFPADVPAIFTDEPNFGKAIPLTQPHEGATELPWTGNLRETFQADWGADLLDVLPWIVWPTPDGPSLWRWRYWDHLSERFAVAFNDQLANWCGEHGIALTGHMLNEDMLNGQVGSVGDCMRQYRSYQIPGIDLLCDDYKPATAKQCVSVARQDGRKLVMSELYGVTNWDFPFSGHKAQGDWQAALGINLRVPHLTWISMEGAAKRDYPASIGPHAPWYREYAIIEDHFARVGAALTEGKALTRIGVIHPIGNAWLNRGVSALDDPKATRHERAYHETIDTLLGAGLDFDFICEALLPGQDRETSEPALKVGQMAYEVVVLPKLEVIRKTTLDRLHAFMARGGTVVVMGPPPNRLDGELSDEPAKILVDAQPIDDDPLALINALEPWRELAVRNAASHHVNTVNHQIRQVGDERIVFCCNRQRSLQYKRPWSTEKTEMQIQLRGLWQVRELDTATGEERACDYYQRDGWTVAPWDGQPQSHRLLRLVPGEGHHETPKSNWSIVGDLPEPAQVQREEPNVLLLDRPEWRLNDEPWQPAEDSLMVQLKLGKGFGWPDWGQPYSVPDAGPKQRVDRRFIIRCDAEFSGLKLMCERLAAATITLDGEPLEAKPAGWWVDQDLTTMPLPTLSPGEHTLVISLELDAVDRYLEWCYVLGEFQVATRGAQARLVREEPVYWGDVTTQGLPFYGGNLDYECNVQIDEPGRYALRCPNFGGALLRVWCDDEDRGPVAFAPYRAELGELSVGAHRVRIRCYGNRMNTFGALHNNRPEWEWWGPPAWRLVDEHRNDIWQLRPTGLLRAPMLEKCS